MERLIRCRRGATAIEYGLFAGLAALILSSGLSTVGEKLGGTFATAGGAMAATPAPAPSPAATAGDGVIIHVGDTHERFLDEHRDRP